MKNKLALFMIILVAACATQSIKQEIAGKSTSEQKAYLLAQCEDESWRGHDSGDHHHYSHKPENEAHAANMVKLCWELANDTAKKPALIEQCKTEAKNGSYGNEYRFNEHANRLTEICEAF